MQGAIADGANREHRIAIKSRLDIDLLQLLAPVIAPYKDIIAAALSSYEQRVARQYASFLGLGEIQKLGIGDTANIFRVVTQQPQPLSEPTQHFIGEEFGLFPAHKAGIRI